MSTIKASGLGPLTASNTATIVDPATPVNGIATMGPLVSFPAATLSGTTVSFTNIPSWSKKITLSFAGVSASAGSLLIQLGTSSGAASTGYVTSGGYYGGSTVVNAPYNNGWFTYGFSINNYPLSGSIVFTLIGSNTWIGNGQAVADNNSGTTNSWIIGMVGKVTLGSTLTGVYLSATSSGSFNAGTANVMYE